LTVIALNARMSASFSDLLAGDRRGEERAVVHVRAFSAGLSWRRRERARIRFSITPY